MRKAILIFAVMALVQWLVPLYGIRHSERVLREGVPLLFLTEPIDPHDPFRGEYVTLGFAMERVDMPQDAERPWKEGEQAYLLLEDSAGVALSRELRRERPEKGALYVSCRINFRLSFREDEKYGDVINIDLPFDRFYLQQGKGRPTEELMWQQSIATESALPAYAQVRILDGDAVIEDLIVGDRSIHDWIKDE